MPNLTKRTFNSTAKLISELPPAFDDIMFLGQPIREYLCNHFADHYWERNEYFDMKKFRKACGLKKGEKPHDRQVTV